ncbi:MAG: flagellar protein FlaG [Planctomycetes bacterium]|nr:flagellar protein FlaG [Planctomycetota bacterium]
MARIDAVVATQVGDSSRPQQSLRDADAQAGEARRIASSASEAPDLAPEPSAEELRASAQRMQKVIETATGRELAFALNDRFKELVVQISDRRSGEVLKEIPSKEFLKLRERLNDLVGLFVDESA